MTLQSLIERYYSNPLLSELEEKRKGIVKKLQITASILILIILGAVLFFKPPAVGLLQLGIAGAVIFSIVYSYLVRGYKKEFKKNIIGSLISVFGEGFYYDPDSFVDQQKFQNSELFGKYDFYKGEDYVKGMLEGVEFEFSDLSVQREVIDPKGNAEIENVFKGAFFVSGFNKKINGKVFVYPDGSEKILGRFAGFFQKSSKGELVKMDSPEFEREFVVYSTDQVLARYVLSTSLMQKILEFKKAVNKPLYFSFKDKNMYTAISGIDNFEAVVFKSLTDEKYAKKLITNFYYIATLVKTLSLERRIWEV